MKNILILLPEYIKNKKDKAFLFLILVVFFIYGFYLRLESLDAVYFNDWITRDFDRAFNLVDGNYIPLAGPEINQGGRLKGPFLYFFMAIPLLFKYSYESIFVYNFILNTLALVMMYLIVRKYFGYYTAVISTILFSVNHWHIITAGWPINPVFIFPFILLSLWFILEFVINKNYKFFPLIYLIITLAIQMHFSMATYYLVPIILAIIFRIKIPKKIILITTILMILCFIPHLIYKSQIYETEVNLLNPYFKKESLSIIDTIRKISVANTINNIAQNPNWINELIFPEHYRTVGYFLISISLYGLIIYVLVNSFRRGLRYYKKEIVSILIFYIPALIYEIGEVGNTMHFWYNFILIPPSILIISHSITTLFQYTKTKTFILQSVAIFSLFGYLTYFTYVSFNYLNNYFMPGMIKIGTHSYNYKNFKSLVSEIESNLNLTPKEYIEKVYLVGHPSYSNRLIELFGTNNSTSAEGKRWECYYIIDSRVSHFKTKYKIANDNLNAFLQDHTLNIYNGPFQYIVIKNNKFTRPFILRVHRYIPKFNQPCYTNSFNPFIVKKNKRDLLKQSYGINQNAGELTIKEVSKNERYDNNLKLISLEESFIVFNQKLNTPLRVIIFLKETNEHYSLKVKIDYSSWGKDIHFWLNRLIFKINIFDDFSSVVPVTKEYEVISKNSWISNKFYMEYMRGAENFNWQREFILPKELPLIKNMFQFDLDWEVKFSNQENYEFNTKVALPDTK